MSGARQRPNHVLVETAFPTEAKELVINGDVEVGVLEIDRHRPIVGTKKGRRIQDRVHPEASRNMLSHLRLMGLQPPSFFRTTNIHDTKPRDVFETQRMACLPKSAETSVHDHNLIRLREDRELRRKRKGEGKTKKQKRVAVLEDAVYEWRGANRSPCFAKK